MSILSLMSYAQSQYDYYDDDAVAGGAGRALNGLLIIIAIVLAIIVIAFIGNGMFKVYYWFNPDADPELKNRKAEEEKTVEKKKKHEEFVQKKRQEEKPEAIDLGLSVLWSNSNLNDRIDSKNTIKYSWGDIKKKTCFRYIDCRLNKKNKYELIRLSGNDDLIISGNEKFDAAKYFWGNNWRLPLKYEFDELVNLCNWEWVVCNEIAGYKITGKNGNFIFLPATGEGVVDKISAHEAGFYWSGTANDDILGEEAYFLYFDKFQKSCKNNGVRWHGMSIRPVWSPTKETIEKEGFILSSFGVRLIKGNDVEDCHIPYGVKIICRDAFKDAKNIKNLYVPETVEEIEDNAFHGLNIESVHIPKSVSKWGEDVFFNCYKLKNVYIEDGLTKLGKGMFCSCSSLNNIVIPDSIKVLPDDVFSCCDSLKEIKLPSRIMSIGNRAFGGCHNLESIVLPDSLLGIGEGTFSECDELSRVIISEGIVALAGHCFRECNSLNKVRIPSSIQHINASAFSCCRGLTLEVPKGTKDKFKEMNIAGVDKITEYKPTIKHDSDVLTAKYEKFMQIQKNKKEREEFEKSMYMGRIIELDFEQDHDYND